MDSTPVSVALGRLLAEVREPTIEAISVVGAAGRVAAQDVVADVPVPHFARSAMDGFAVVARAGMTTSRLEIVGSALPGRGYAGTISGSEAVSVATGAPLPAGADAVIRVEQTEVLIGPDGAKVLSPQCDVAIGKDVGQIGEDIARGSVVVSAGRRLRPQDLGVLSSVGAARVDVFKRPTVRILITGNEVLPAGERPTGSQIVDANGPMLTALVGRDGAGEAHTTYLPDDFVVLTEQLKSATEDVVLITGGSSVGVEDHAERAIREVGRLLIHRVAIRPGAPTGFGRCGQTLVFLIPGNPVAALCAYEFFAGPVLRTLGGRSSRWPHARRIAPMACSFESRAGRTDFVRVTLSESGVTPIALSGASILSSTTKADGIMVVEDQQERLAVDEEVEVLMFDA